MVSIPKHVQDFFPGKMGWVATATKEGLPNVTPKGSVRVLDDQHVIFADLFSLKTRQNLEQNPRVAVTVIDRGNSQGLPDQGNGRTGLVGSALRPDGRANEAISPFTAPADVCRQDRGGVCLRSIRRTRCRQTNCLSELRVPRVAHRPCSGRRVRPRRPSCLLHSSSTVLRGFHPPGIECAGCGKALASIHRS